ncbi:hypothetical protein QYF61_010431 [Mycteria americana]|uniref:Uncharacterized protein n=1 Tax=Mycteria americana TaxID=33587 RepID=A0AAN7N5C7_MYCAM|nr:hypothetical protein QYF61_010431 [Mycteria americana]
MWQKLVQSTPSYANSLAILTWKDGERPMVDEVASQLWEYEESISSSLVSTVEKLVQQLKEDRSYSPPVQTSVSATRSQCSSAQERAYKGAGKNCPLNFSQGVPRLSCVEDDTLLSWEEGIGVTEVAYFASAFRSCFGAMQTGDATRSLLGLEPQARHREMRDPLHRLVILGSQQVSEALCSVRPSASSWPLDSEPMLVANSIASVGVVLDLTYDMQTSRNSSLCLVIEWDSSLGMHQQRQPAVGTLDNSVLHQQKSIEVGWRLNHFPGQPLPMLDNPLSEVTFPNIQSKPPLAQLEAISSCPITCYLGEETDPHLSTASFQAEQPQFPQPLLIRLLLQTLHQLRCPSLDSLQHLHVSLVVGGPKLNTVFEVRPHQCRVQGHDHFPSPAGHAVSDTSQDAIGLLGRLGTLLAHIQASVNQHAQVLFRCAAFQPLFPRPVALHGVAVAQVQDLALGLVKPHTIDLGPSIQPVQVPLQGLPTLQQTNTPAQLGVICKLTEGALNPFVQVIDKDIKQDWPQRFGASHLKKVAGSIAQLKCIYTNVCSMGNKHEELEVSAQQEIYYIVVITETWWDDSHNWSAAMDGYKLLRRDREGRRGNVCWKYSTAERKQFTRFLECVEDNFLTQLVSEPTREGTPLDLLFVNREGLVGDVMVGGRLGCSSHKMIVVLIPGEVRRGVSRTATLDFCRADFGLFRSLLDRVPWGAVLKGKGVQEGWTFFKKEILKVHEQAIHHVLKDEPEGKKTGLAE